MSTSDTLAIASVHRIVVQKKPGAPDPEAQSLLREAEALGTKLTGAKTSRVYLLQAELTDEQLASITDELLVNPVLEIASSDESAEGVVVEVHPLPGVMDPVAQSVATAVEVLTGSRPAVQTAHRYELAGVTQDQAHALAERLLANTVVNHIHDGSYHPDSLPTGSDTAFELTYVPIRELDNAALEVLSRDGHLFLDLHEMQAIRAKYQELGREPTDIELETLAQTWSEHCVHKTLKSTVHYTGPEVDTIDWSNRPGHVVNSDGSVTINNLLKSTVAAATFELIEEGLDWTLSVFVDNAGIIEFDDEHAVCIKVETHNHPSAIEPYGGAATGIGGCIRDIMGTGLAAKPIASTDVFCVAPTELRDRVYISPPADFKHSWIASAITMMLDGDAVYTARLGERRADGKVEMLVYRGQRQSDGHKQFEDSPLNTQTWFPTLLAAYEKERTQSPDSQIEKPEIIAGLPDGCLPPDRVLKQVVGGVRDYGNRMGIPTVNGAVWFDERYVGNPLVYCGCIGVMPRDMIEGDAKPGDLIVALGGRTGRDGIHGATFSSAELTDTHADEFSHAVQIGNAIEEKRVLDATLRARDAKGGPLFSSVTDCGAGGFSSAVGEMGEKVGAVVHLENAPLKYTGLTYSEIWISEAQERMVFAVAKENIDAFQAICDEEHVELAILGEFGNFNDANEPELVLNYLGNEVGRLPMPFMHDGIPTPTRTAIWTSPTRPDANSNRGEQPSIKDALLRLLAHPNIASKRSIIRQYDHEVQGNVVLKPLVGPGGEGPGDAAVIEPVPGSGKGLAIGCGLATNIGDPLLGGDPYQMTLAAIDECVRNLVCVGANPDRIAILDNFCWPSCKKPENLASLVRAAEGCYDGAKAYKTPFVSGKDSLNNQFTTNDGRTIEIPPTLLITGMGIVEDVNTCITMDAKQSGNVLAYLHNNAETESLAGSHFEQLFGATGGTMPSLDLTKGPAAAKLVHSLIASGSINSAHDVSDGGLLVAVAEMLIAAESEIGAALDMSEAPAMLFAEPPSGYVLEMNANDFEAAAKQAESIGMSLTKIATFNTSGVLTSDSMEIGVDELTKAWLGKVNA